MRLGIYKFIFSALTLFWIVIDARSSTCKSELKELFSIRFELSSWTWAHQTGPYSSLTPVGVNNGVIAGERAFWARPFEAGKNQDDINSLGFSVNFFDAQIGNDGAVLKIRTRNTWDHSSAHWYSIPYTLEHLADQKVPRVEFSEEFLKSRPPNSRPPKLHEGTVQLAPITEQQSTSWNYFEGELRISQKQDHLRINHFALGPKAAEQWVLSPQASKQELVPIQEVSLFNSPSFVFVTHQNPYQAAAKWQMLSFLGAIVGTLKKEGDLELIDKSPLEIAANALGLFGSSEVKQEAQKLFAKIQKTGLQNGELKLMYFQKNPKPEEPSITTVSSLGTRLQKRNYYFTPKDSDTLEIKVVYEVLTVNSEETSPKPALEKSTDRVIIKVSSDGRFYWRPETRLLIPTPQIGYSNKMGFPPPSDAISEVFDFLPDSPTPLKTFGPQFESTLFSSLDHWILRNSLIQAIRTRGTSVIPSLSFMTDETVVSPEKPEF